MSIEKVTKRAERLQVPLRGAKQEPLSGPKAKAYTRGSRFLEVVTCDRSDKLWNGKHAPASNPRVETSAAEHLR